jgi:hypothetical protein
VVFVSSPNFRVTDWSGLAWPQILMGFSLCRTIPSLKILARLRSLPDTLELRVIAKSKRRTYFIIMG